MEPTNVVRRTVGRFLNIIKKELYIMENGFRGYHPYVVFFYYLCTGFLIMYFKHPLFLLIALILLIFINISHDRGQALKKWTIPLVVMSLFFIMLKPFLVSRGTNILFYFRGKQVTLEALTYGVVMALTIVIILMMFISFNIVLNGNKFLFVFSRILPKTAFLIMLTIRFIPLLKERYDEIETVQQVKGKSLKAGSLINRMKSGMNFMQILLAWSLEEAIQTADAMKARGYGTGKKSSYIPYKIQGRDWASLILLTLLFAICLFGGSLGYGKIVIYPELGTLQLYLLDWITFISMILLLAFPIIIEGREKVRWTFSI